MTRPWILSCWALGPWFGAAGVREILLSVIVPASTAGFGCSCAGQRLLVVVHLPEGVCTEILWITEVGVRLCL